MITQYEEVLAAYKTLGITEDSDYSEIAKKIVTTASEAKQNPQTTPDYAVHKGCLIAKEIIEKYERDHIIPLISVTKEKLDKMFINYSDYSDVPDQAALNSKFAEYEEKIKKIEKGFGNLWKRHLGSMIEDKLSENRLHFKQGQAIIKLREYVNKKQILPFFTQKCKFANYLIIELKYMSSNLALQPNWMDQCVSKVIAERPSEDIKNWDFGKEISGLKKIVNQFKEVRSDAPQSFFSSASQVKKEDNTKTNAYNLK